MSIKPNTDRNIQRKRETQIKRRTLAPTISHNIVGNCYTHSETKKYESRDVRIHADLPIIYPDTETDRERVKRVSREVPIHVQSVTT